MKRLEPAEWPFAPGDRVAWLGTGTVTAISQNAYGEFHVAVTVDDPDGAPETFTLIAPSELVERWARAEATPAATLTPYVADPPAPVVGRPSPVRVRGPPRRRRGHPDPAVRVGLRRRWEQLAVDYRHRPLSDLSPFTGDYEDSPFRATFRDTMDVLDRELYMLDAERIVIEVDVKDSQIRIDGRLRGDSRPASPAVRLAFDSRFGPLQYATDKYLHRSYVRTGAQQDWQHNLRAIALTLEALRKVERYGASVSGQQYAGYKQIGWTGSDLVASHLTGTEAVEQLWRVAYPDDEVTAHDVEEVLDDTELLRSLAKRAVLTAHPDKWHGSTELWDRVQAAKTALRLP